MDSMCTNFVQLNASSSILIQSLEDCSEDPLDLLHQCRSHSNAVQIYAYFLMYMLTTDEADSEPAAEMSVARGAPKVLSKLLIYIQLCPAFRFWLNSDDYNSTSRDVLGRNMYLKRGIGVH